MTSSTPSSQPSARPASELPAMSFLMITYNQEKYIKQALESALAQDYPALEIIVCDDASKDRTFEIASDIAKSYHGPFNIILHKNETNLGIGANFYQAFSLAHSDWLFMAAGDDISLPNRCRAVADGIRQFPQALAFGSNYQVIDGDSKVCGFFSPDFILPPGAMLCWHRSLFEAFPPLGKHLRVEDMAMVTRVFYLGGILVKLPLCTVQYRIDGHSFTGAGRNTPLAVKQCQLKIHQTLLDCVKQRLSDMEYAQSHGHVIRHDDIHLARQTWAVHEIERDMASFQRSVEVLQGSLGTRLRYLLTPSELVQHQRFAYRLRTLISSFDWLRHLKHLVVKPQERLPLFVQKNLVNELPANLKPMLFTPEHYLQHEICDFYQAEDHESFDRDYLLPERKARLLAAEKQQS